MESGTRLLLIDSDPDRARFHSQSLTTGYGFEVETADTIQTALTVLRSNVIDCVIIVCEIGDTQAFEVLSRVRARFGQLPIVVLIDGDDKSVEGEVFKFGTTEFVALSVLETSLEPLVESIQEVVSESYNKTVTKENSGSLFCGEFVFDVAVHEPTNGAADKEVVEPDTADSPSSPSEKWKPQTTTNESKAVFKQDSDSTSEAPPTTTNGTEAPPSENNEQKEANTPVDSIEPTESTTKESDSGQNEAPSLTDSSRKDLESLEKDDLISFISEALEGEVSNEGEADDQGGEDKKGGADEVIYKESKVDDETAEKEESGLDEEAAENMQDEVNGETGTDTEPITESDSEPQPSDHPQEEMSPATTTRASTERKKATSSDGGINTIETPAATDSGNESTQSTATEGADPEAQTQASRNTDASTAPASSDNADASPLAELSLSPATSVLIKCGSQNNQKRDLQYDILSKQTGQIGNVLLIRYRSMPQDRLQSIVENADNVSIITIGCSQPVPPGLEETVEIMEISDPNDVRRLGILATDVVSNWADSTGGKNVSIEPLDILFNYKSVEGVFRFLHILIGKFSTHGAVTQVYIDPSAIGEKSSNTIKPLFDHTITIDS